MPSQKTRARIWELRILRGIGILVGSITAFFLFLFVAIGVLNAGWITVRTASSKFLSPDGKHQAIVYTTNTFGAPMETSVIIVEANENIPRFGGTEIFTGSYPSDWGGERYWLEGAVIGIGAQWIDSRHLHILYDVNAWGGLRRSSYGGIDVTAEAMSIAELGESVHLRFAQEPRGGRNACEPRYTQ